MTAPRRQQLSGVRFGPVLLCIVVGLLAVAVLLAVPAGSLAFGLALAAVVLVAVLLVATVVVESWYL